ncbi:MAG: hypothetical protein QOE25_150, partial [Actinomycetota bacterium]|nr:hypothetical protein [Actinomycetota bacterium]
GSPSGAGRRFRVAGGLDRRLVREPSLSPERGLALPAFLGLGLDDQGRYRPGDAVLVHRDEHQIGGVRMA